MDLPWLFWRYRMLHIPDELHKIARTAPNPVAAIDCAVQGAVAVAPEVVAEQDGVDAPDLSRALEQVDHIAAVAREPEETRLAGAAQALSNLQVLGLEHSHVVDAVHEVEVQIICL